jgi:hypothetical protein
MRVTIKADTAQMQRKLQTLVDKQLTFAAAVAATKTAVEVRNNYVLPHTARLLRRGTSRLKRWFTTWLRRMLDLPRPLASL